MQDYRPNPNGSFNNQPQHTDYHKAYQSTAIDTRMDEETLVLAGAGERIGACIVDSLPIFVIGIVAALIMPAFRNTAELGMLVFIALVLAYLVYQVVLMTKYGQTFGKKLLGIRVVNADGDNPGFVKYVLVREFGYNLILSILGAIPLLGGIISIVALIANLVLLFIVERDRRVLWDLLANTYVVKV